MNPDKPFLTALWRHLIMLNYEVDPSLLLPHVPAGTKLDYWDGRPFMSLVGFRFLNTRVLGISFPFHSNFEEVNLRIYVQRTEGELIKRGVVFIREIVPRRLIAFLARAVYNENYIALPMSHQIHPTDHGGLAASYSWKSGNICNKLALTVAGVPAIPGAGSQEQFITEHYWGYARQQNGGCIEYRVAHPAWKVWTAQDAVFEGDVADLYGKHLARIMEKEPSSAFLADGSDVTVYQGRRL